MIYWFRLAFFALVLIVPVARASEAFVPIQERAQGQSLVGSSMINDSLYSNPAAGAFTNVYAVDGTFLSTQTFEASIFDTKTSSMGGGLGYFREAVDGGIERQGAVLALVSRLSNVFGLGISGKSMWQPGDSFKDLDAGLTANMAWLQMGLVVRNFAAGGDLNMDQYREYALGARVSWEKTLFFSVAANAKWGSLNPYQFGFGAEYISPWYFAIKGGYLVRNDVNTSNWSGGVSFVSPRLSLHYAAVFPAVAGGQIEHTISTTILF